MNEYKVVYRVRCYIVDGSSAIINDEFEIIEAEGAAKAIEIASNRCTERNKAEGLKQKNGTTVVTYIKCVRDIWRL